jgi:hypothetical protein
MQMTRRIMVFVLASIAVIATIALVSVGLNHAQAMRENSSFMGSTGGHMSQDNHQTCDENMSTHMNATGNMPGNMLDECGDVHDDMNMAGHMMGMH